MLFRCSHRQERRARANFRTLSYFCFMNAAWAGVLMFSLTRGRNGLVT